MEFIRIGKGASDELFISLAELDKMCFDAESWSADSFKAEAENDNGIVICVYVDTNVIGLICGYFAADESDIASVAVHPEYRRMGLADRLMDEFESCLPDITNSIYLDVRESNVPAISLYEKHGFKRLTIRKNYYEKPAENAVIMQKVLNKEGKKC